MKVVCDACDAKYQVPDERVAGRKIKIRCRRCGGAILIRGEHLALPPIGVPEVADEWHVSIEGDQYGPCTLEQLGTMLRAGELPWEAYIWREGYGNWRSAAESDTLVRAAAAAGQDDEPTAAMHAPAGSEEDIPTRMLQATHLPQTYAASQSARPQAYAAAASAAYAGGYAARGGGHAMSGQRNEDSVLFSARNIRQSIAPVPGSARAGYASGAGSGLIDIRSLASLAHTRQSAPPVAARSVRPVRPTESTLAVPNRGFHRRDTLAPVERPRRRSRALPIAIVSGTAMIAAAALLIVYITRATPEGGPSILLSAPPVSLAASAEAPAVPAPAAPAEANAAAEPAAAPEAAPPTEAANELLTAVKTPEPEALDEPERARAPSRSARSERKRASSTRAPKRSEKEPAVAKAAKAPAEPAAKEGEELDDLLLADEPADKPADKPAAKSTSPASDDDPLLGAMDAPVTKEPAKNRSIDDLLDSAVVAAKKGTSAPASDLPETPSRDQVKAAMRAVESDVRACAEGQTLESSSATVALTVSGSSGRVTGARVTGNQGAVGSCIARAVRGATFPKFSKSEFSINFPFKLN